MITPSDQLEALSASTPAITSSQSLGQSPAEAPAPTSSTPSTAAAPPPAKPQEDSAVLKLKGLPYNTTEEAIRKFFAGFQIEEINFVYEPDGRPSGLAFAEFSDKEEAVKVCGHAALSSAHLLEQLLPLLPHFQLQNRSGFPDADAACCRL